MKEEFVKFLNENGVYDQFCSNLHDFKCVTICEYLSSCGAEIYDYIDSAFLWFKTEEGDSFWGEIDRDWIKRVEGLEK
jgi:hypothetical protein